MRILNHGLLTAGVLVLAAGPAAAQSTPAPVPPLSFTRTYTFPPIGLSGTETLQVNIVNLMTIPPGSEIATIPAGSAILTITCSGTIMFADSYGKAIGSPVKFSVGGGQIFSAPLPFSATGYSSRGEILATVQQTVVLSTSVCTLGMSLETFDTNSGVTHAIETASPAPPFLPVLRGTAIPPGPSQTTVTP